MEKVKNNFMWPVVVIVCACIIASGIYFGLKKIQPQTTLQPPNINPPIDNNSLTNRNLMDVSKIVKKDEKNNSGIEEKRQKELKDIEQKELNDIDKIFNEKRQRLESDYHRAFVQLEYNTKAALINLDVSQNSAYTKFQQDLKNTISESQGYATMNAYVWNNNYISGYGYYSGTTRTSVKGNPAKDYAIKNAQIAIAKTGTLEYYQQNFIRLQQNRQSDLAMLAEERERMIDSLRANINSAKKPKQQFLPLVVGIVFSEYNPSAVVGDLIVHEGDTIQGDTFIPVKVVKIYKDRIEFEKNGKNWTQQVGDSPNPAWQE